ncbi:CBU_0592 family membrane protein [Ideonella livida]|uniref:CBU_0592 family membrane protein n=1 Tax=Ideonella livida TaxID=2707176 RepID=UPI001940261D|nr:hypothetical protein [Ideonella livida]
MIRLGPLDLVGLAGVCAYVVAHFLVQVRHEPPLSRRVVLLNVIGPLCVLASLAGAFNLSSFLSQSLWLLLTLAGWWRQRRAHAKPGPGVAGGHVDVVPAKPSGDAGITVEPGP